MWFKRVWPANRPFVKMKKKIWRTSSSCLKPQMFGPMLVIGSVGRFDCWFSYSRDFGSFSILFLDPCLRKKCKEYLQYIKLKFHILGLSLNMFFFSEFFCVETFHVGYSTLTTPMSLPRYQFSMLTRVGNPCNAYSWIFRYSGVILSYCGVAACFRRDHMYLTVEMM